MNKFRSVTQETMFACAEVAHLNLSPKRLASQCFPLEILKAVLDKDTGELMEYHTLVKNPKYRKLYRQSYAKALGQLAEGIPGKVTGTNTMFFINKTKVPADCWRDIAYGCVVVNYRPKKDDPY